VLGIDVGTTRTAAAVARDHPDVDRAADHDD
jgi:molecular chaperone DnaK (HSP70)